MINRKKFFLAVNTGYVDNCSPNEKFIEFYRQRASEHLYCAIVGNVVVPNGDGTNANTPQITSSVVWAQIADGVAERGSLPGIQLATTWKNYIGITSFKAKQAGNEYDAYRQVAKQFDATSINRILDNFDDATKLAIAHGFRHVQIHAAHGYLLSILIDDRISPHYEQVLDRLSDYASRWRAYGIETSIRISMKAGDPIVDTDGEASYVDKICRMDFEYVDLSSGYYNIDKRLIYPSTPLLLESRRHETVLIARRYPNQSFIYSGRAFNYLTDDLPENISIGVCRDLIANPNFLIDAANGCKNSSKCHYYSRGLTHITCAQWLAER